MSPTLDATAITAQRDQWKAQLAEVQAKITTLTNELAQLQQAAVSLDGAIQGANVFLQSLGPQPVSGTDTQAPPADAPQA